MAEQTKHREGLSMTRTCIGYGEHEGRCTNPVDAPRSDHWCARCDDIRFAAITKNFEDILARFDEKVKEANNG